jgi:hypothetical protein
LVDVVFADEDLQWDLLLRVASLRICTDEAGLWSRGENAADRAVDAVRRLASTVEQQERNVARIEIERPA